MNPSPDLVRSRSQGAAFLVRARDRWRGWTVYLAALLIFAASRLVVVVGVLFGKGLAGTPHPGQWEAGSAWYYRLLRWDSGWYASIARDGYHLSADPGSPSSTVFYPLYPLAAAAIKTLFGIDAYLALLIVANGAAFLVALLLTKLVKDAFGPETALLALAFFSFFPYSLFLSAGYTESLFLVFALLSLLALTRQRVVLAAAFAGLAFATRPTGIVLIPVILWEMRRQSSLPWSRLLPKMVLSTILAASGLLLYMAYLGIRFGQPLAFATGQDAWQGGTLAARFVAAFTFGAFGKADLPSALLFLSFLGLSGWSFRCLPRPLALYGLGTLLLPYFTLGVTSSIGRFALLCFPAAVVAALLTRGRPWLANLLIGVSGALLLVATAAFSHWSWVG